MDEITRQSAAPDADQHTDHPIGYEQREDREPHEHPKLPDRDGPRRRQSMLAAGRPAPRRAPVPAAAPDRDPQPPEPADLVPDVAALVRLAVLCVDPDGRISYWNRGAEELFGHHWEHVFGHRASELLSARPSGTAPAGVRSAAQHQDTLDLLDDLTQPAWAGALAATDREGVIKDVLWWTYRIMEPTGPSLLAIAAHAKPLRTGSLRIALGGRLLPYTAQGPQRQDISVAAVLTPADDPARARAMAARLRGVLPGVSPGRLDRIVRQIAPLGQPGLEVEGSTRLPVVPHDYAQVSAASRAAARSVRRELPPPPYPDGPAAGGATPPVGDLSRASALTAVPLPSVTSLSPASSSPGFTAVPTTAAARQTPRPTAGTALDEQLALLRETGAVVGSTLDLQTTARELCTVTVPRFADFAAVLIVEELFSDTEPPNDDRPRSTVLIRRVAIAYEGPPGVWEAALPEGELLTLPAAQIVPRAGDPVLIPVVDPTLAPDIASDLGVPSLAPLLPGHSMIVAPLSARGTVLGRVCFLRGPGRRPFDARDAATATEVVSRGAVHIDNARLHLQESRAAATLQRSMMPTRPPRIPGVRIAHHYMPGDRQAQVGGDWFDAIQLPGGRVALIVGDVMGHGLQAATVMGQFRTAVITMAALDLPPAQLLRHLDNLAHRLSPEHLATCVYTVYDPIARTLTLANAGHIPPVLSAGYDGRSELLEIPGGAPIGVGGVPFETVEVPVPDGSWLVLCTDGLVEVRGQGIDAGLAALCATVIEPEQTPEDVCAQILARVHSEDRRDDVALLVARFEGIPPQDVARWTLRLDNSEVAAARDLTRRQLAAWGLGRLSDTTELLVSELVTNAIRAASYEVELRLMRVGKLLVEVSDDNHNMPHLQRADADDQQGRGLALVSQLSQRWGTSRKAVGKVVWFELPLPTA
ncbi:SpoIIE family protein phosphatase [Actinacidiphila sp. ITFR-21]|uniref:SpoIIE family protein phosphatase n=1 Tax=Actinacidiphila sp. ITFR-21 TaxID=3075199 RepID=UPI00288A74FD|nr:SpoIIE family protein phosphatase [Streptomyces sp. ITFR-21]WNI16699.1 SpoIIE family protein phosphatase [Streptomyces sp. ITFR-21]